MTTRLTLRRRAGAAAFAVFRVLLAVLFAVLAFFGDALRVAVARALALGLAAFRAGATFRFLAGFRVDAAAAFLAAVFFLAPLAAFA